MHPAIIMKSFVVVLVLRGALGLQAPLRQMRTGRQRLGVVSGDDVMAGAQIVGGMQGDLIDLPNWIQESFRAVHQDVTTIDDEETVIYGNQLFLAFLGLYVSRGQWGDKSRDVENQSLSDDIRRERRRRSGLGEPTQLQDVDPDTWFDDDIDTDTPDKERP